MAFRAFALLGARFKLAFMGVGLVTVITIIERQLLFEFTVLVAINASHFGVLSQQGVLCFGVIEFKSRKKFLPTRRGVAVFATLGFERALVGIDVAIYASLELHISIARRPAGFIRLVALFTRYLDVETRQRIARLGMVKLICGFPIRKVVALQAVVTELALMHIFVARYAILRQPEERF